MLKVTRTERLSPDIKYIIHSVNSEGSECHLDLNLCTDINSDEPAFSVSEDSTLTEAELKEMLKILKKVKA